MEQLSACEIFVDSFLSRSTEQSAYHLISLAALNILTGAPSCCCRGQEIVNFGSFTCEQEEY